MDLGLPIDLSEEPSSNAEEWDLVHQRANESVKNKLPELKNPREFGLPAPTETPYRLYRNIIPPALAVRGDRLIAFTGMLVTSQIVIFSELSSLYAVAYMEDLLPSPLPWLHAMKQEIALTNAWTEARYGHRGVREPLNLSEQTFFDLLCADLGIQSHRKRGTKALLDLDRTARDWFQPYRPSDYRGLVGEFLRNARSTERSHGSSSKSESSIKALVVTETEVSDFRDQKAPICHKIGHGIGLTSL